MQKSRSDTGVAGQVDTDVDRYPDAVTGLRRVVGEANLPDGPIERLEVTFLASGEATVRVWAPRADESDGDYIPAPAK